VGIRETKRLGRRRSKTEKEREREREREREEDVEERKRETRRDREHERPVSTGVCMMGEAPPRLEFPLGLVLAI